MKLDDFTGLLRPKLLLFFFLRNAQVMEICEKIKEVCAPKWKEEACDWARSLINV